MCVLLPLICVSAFGRSKMTEDLQHLKEDKDSTRSCVFDYPDRPVDSLPPDLPPPGTGPPDLPYDPTFDWPFIPVGDRPIPGSDPHPVPPGTINLGDNFFSIDGGTSIVIAPDGFGVFCKMVVSSLGEAGDLSNGVLAVYLGGAGTPSDYIASVQGGPTGKLFDVDFLKLMTAFPGVATFVIDVQLGQVAKPIGSGFDWPIDGVIQTNSHSDGGINDSFWSVGMTPNVPPSHASIKYYFTSIGRNLKRFAAAS